MADFDENNNLDNVIITDDGDQKTTTESSKPTALEVLDNIQQRILQNLEYYEPQVTNSIIGYVESANSLGNIMKQDFGPTMEMFSVHDPYGDPNLFVDRYEAFSASYKIFGFSPYRNNEAIYNSRTTQAEKWYKALKSFNHLTWIALQQNSFFASGWGDNQRSKDLAKEYNYWNAIGMTNEEGTNAFLQNLLVTYGSTAAVFVKMAVEELVTSVVLGALTGGTGAVAEGVKATTRIGKLIQSTKNVIKNSVLARKLATTSMVSPATTFGSKFGKYGSAGLEFIAPGLVGGSKAGINAVKNGKYLAGIGYFAHAVYNPLRAYKITQSEALLEANLAADQYVHDMANSGKQFTDREVDEIKLKAQAISNEVFWKNIPTIYASNLVVFNSLISPIVAKGVNKAFSKTTRLFGKAKNIMPTKVEGGKWYNAMYKVGTGKPKLRSEYALKGLPVALGYYSGKLGKMFVLGSSEGLQENIQDVISASARTYYENLYLDDERFKEMMGASYSGFGIPWESISNISQQAVSQQFTKQGWETFLTGTLMGGPTAAVSSLAHTGINGVKRFNDWTKLKDIEKKNGKDSDVYKKAETAYNYKYNKNGVATERWEEIYKQTFDNPTNFFNRNLETMSLIEGISDDEIKAQSDYDERIAKETDIDKKNLLIKEREESLQIAKQRQWSKIFRTMSSNGSMEILLDELRQYKNEDADVLESIWNNHNNPQPISKIKEDIDQAIKFAELTSEMYDKLLEDTSNPSDMTAFLKQFDCKSVVEFMIKYKNDETKIEMLEKEMIKNIAYQEAIDDILFYTNELTISENKKKNIIQQYNETTSKIISKLSNNTTFSTQSEINSLLSSDGIADLLTSYKMLLKSNTELLKTVEGESERKQAQKRQDELETAISKLNKIVELLDNKGISIDDLRTQLEEQLKGTINDKIIPILISYYENYKNNKRLFDIINFYKNPNNLNNIITDKLNILFDIYSKRHEIIEKALAKENDNEAMQDLINELYKKGYAVDIELVNSILHKDGILKGGYIYKIKDKEFNKTKRKKASGNEEWIQTYSSNMEAFKNSFDEVLHPLSKEYHDIVKFIEQWINDRNQKDGTNLDTNALFRLQSNADFQQAKSNNEFVQPNQTVESIEEEYFDNKTDRLDLFEVTRVKHNINDVLDKIYNKMSETNPLRSLITALKKYNEQNNIKVVLTTNDNTKLPYTIYDNTIFIDTRYFDKRYFTDQLQGFELALLKANVEHIIRNELVKGKGQKIVKELADVFGIEYEDERNIKDIASKLSSFMLGTGQDRLVSSIDTEGMDKIKKSDAFYDFVNILSDYLSKMNITTGANQQYVTNLLDAIQVLFSGVGNYVAPKPSTPVNSTVTPSPSGTPVVTPKGTKVVKIGNSIDIDEGSISKSYSELSNIQRFVIWYSPKSTNVAKWLEYKHRQHLANKDYQKDKSNIEKRKETYKQAKIQNIDITRGKGVDIETASEYKRIAKKEENTYVYIEYFNIDLDELDEYNKAITTTALQPVTPNTNVSIIGSIEGYGKKIEVGFNPENHEYTFIDENGNRISTDTTASSFTDELYKILNPDYKASTESTASTAIGNVYDAAMREYFNTGKVTNAIFDVFEQNGILVNADTKLRNTLLDNLNNICKDAMQKIVDTIDKGADVSNFKFNTDEKRYIVRVNVTDNNGEQRSYTVGMSHDMIVEHNGKLYLVDFKTTKKDKLGQYNLQTYLYAKALEKISGQKFAGRMVISQTKVMPTDVSNITDDELKSLFSGDATVKEFNTEPSVSLEENGNKIMFTVTDVTLLGGSSNTIQQTTNDVINDFIGTGKSANKKETFNIILLLDAIRSNSLDKTEVLNGVLEGYKYSGKPKSLHIVKYESTTDGSIVFALSTDYRFNSGYNVVGRYALSQYTTDIVNELQSNVEISQSSNVVDNEVVNQKMMQYNELLADITEDNENYDANNLKELLTKLCK